MYMLRARCTKDAPNLLWIGQPTQSTTGVARTNSTQPRARLQTQGRIDTDHRRHGEDDERERQRDTPIHRRRRRSRSSESSASPGTGKRDQRHAAFWATAGRVAHDLGMHRAGIFGAARHRVDHWCRPFRTSRKSRRVKNDLRVHRASVTGTACSRRDAWRRGSSVRMIVFGSLGDTRGRRSIVHGRPRLPSLQSMTEMRLRLRPYIRTLNEADASVPDGIRWTAPRSAERTPMVL